MNIATLFHTIFLKPFELLLEAILNNTYYLTKNPGLSIILLSLFITAITTPLYYLAEKWKSEEKKLQAKMKVELDSINTHYQGQKKFYLTKTVHRIYGYKWYHTLKTSFGLFLQIPFFFAAYNVLSHYTPFTGKSFFIINDLGKPDGLLNGIHALPFIMSFVNISYSFYYTRAKSIQQNKEQLILALVFFILLYNSPSALLIYWTMNNIFSFMKGIIFRKLKLEHYIPLPEVNKKISLKNIYEENKSLILGLIIYFIWFTQPLGMKSIYKGSNYFIVAMILFAGIATLLYLLSNRFKKLLVAITIWIPFIGLFIIATFKKQILPSVESSILKYLFVISSAIITFWFLKKSISKKHEYNKINNPNVKNYYFLMVSTILYIFFLNPLTIYLNEPQTVGFPLKQVFEYCLIVTALIVIVLSIIYKLSFKKNSVKFIIVFISISALAYPLLFNLDVGALHDLSFSNASFLENMSFRYYLTDFLIVSAISFLSVYIIKSKPQFINILTTIILGVAFIGTFAATRNYTPVVKSIVDLDQNNLPIGSKEKHKFSEDGINVIFYIADMFNGNYLNRIIEDDESYKEKLENFIYYPDTLAPSYATVTSMAALLGGHSEHTKDFNKHNLTFAELIDKNNLEFFELFKSQDFKIIANDLYHFGTQEISIIDFRENSTKYEESYLKNKEIELKSNKLPILTLLSLFNKIPWSLREALYDNARWGVYSSNKMMAEFIASTTVSRLAYIDQLPLLSDVGANTNKLFYIHNNLPHNDFGITKDGSLIENNYPEPYIPNFHNSKAALYSAKKTIDILSNWFDWMKLNEVWDNTFIIVLSDHGNLTNDDDIEISSEQRKEFAGISRASSLLMVKPLNSNEPFVIDYSQLSGADIKNILLNELSLFEMEVEDPRKRNEERSRHYSIIDKAWSTIDWKVDRVLPVRTYEVKGSMFDGDSWSLYEH